MGQLLLEVKDQDLDGDEMNQGIEGFEGEPETREKQIEKGDSSRLRLK